MPTGLASLVGRVAVITGGASGIGRALALALAREGADVAVADVAEAGMAETVAAVEALGRSGLALRTDVADQARQPRGHHGARRATSRRRGSR